MNGAHGVTRPTHNDTLVGRAVLCPPKGSSSRHINRITAWSGPKINPARLVSPFLLRRAEIIPTAPRCGNETRIIPSRLDPRAIPCAAVIQDKYQSGLIACARALHDVEVVIREQDLRWAGGVLFVNFHKRIECRSDYPAAPGSS